MTCARMIKPSLVQKTLGETATSVLGHLQDFKAQPLAGPIKTEVACLSRRGAELMAYLPMVERVDAHNILQCCFRKNLRRRRTNYSVQ